MASSFSTKTSGSSHRVPFIPPFFNKFGKNTKDLFKKKYEFDHTIKTINRSKAGVVLESGALLTDAGSLRGFIKATHSGLVQKSELNVEAFTDAAQESKANWKFNNLANKNLSVNVGASSKEKDRAFKAPTGSFELEYSQDYFSATATAKSDLTTHKVEATAAVGSDGVSVGGQVQFDVSKGAELVESNIGAEYRQDDLIASFYTEKNGQFVNASYYQLINRDHQLGANFRYELNAGKAGDRALTVGTEYRVDSDTIVKAKAELPTGDIATVIEHRLNNPKLLLAVAAQFNARSQKFSADKLGVGLTFGDY